jgi:two-component system, NarL family, sensor histidine kinase UhpB
MNTVSTAPILEDAQLLRSLVEASPLAMVTWNTPDGLDYVVNDAVLQLTGARSYEELMRHGGVTRTLDEDHRAAVQGALRTHGQWSGRVRLRTLQGEIRWVDASARMEGSRGWAILQDVTEQVAMSAEVIATQARFNRMLVESGIAIFVIEGGSRQVIHANEAAAEISGYPDARTFLATEPSVHDLFNERDTRGFQDELERVGMIESREVALMRLDGRVVWIRGNVTVNREEGLYEIVAMDITAEREARQALEASERRYRTLFDNAVVGMFQANLRDGRLLAANDRYLEMMGAESSEHLSMLAETHYAPARERLARGLQQRVAGARGPSTTEHELTRPDGASIWIQLHCQIDVGHDRIDGVVVDITEQRAAAADRERLLQEVARRSDERRGLVRQLLRTAEDERRQVAYEIHDGPAQQLTAASMYLETFQQEFASGRGEAARARLDSGIEYLHASLVETRRIMANLRPALLDDLGLEAALRSSLEHQLDGKVKLRMERVGEQTALDATVEAILFRVGQEAAGNAAKHSGASEVHVRLDYQDPHWVQLTVDDRGRGFRPADVRPRVEGRQLGLVGMRERVELVMGTFEIISEEGQGTTVRTLVPRWPVTPAAETIETPD